MLKAPDGGPSDHQRYTLIHRIGTGGMAEVFIGRMQGKGGFARTVAIKRLHRNLIDDETFVTMLLDEARLAGRIQHPNVASATDVLEQDGEVLLVMDYIVGETLGKLVKKVGADGGHIPYPILSAIVENMLAGLQAAHTAVDEAGKPLGIVHRDVSPQNVLVGADGTARVLDFGIAKASSRLQTTREGQVKGKLGYMAPEQLRQLDVDPRTDVFAVGVVLWEAITGRRLFAGIDAGGVVTSILMGPIEKPSKHRDDIPRELEALVLRALERSPARRFDSASDMAAALEQAVTPASSRVVSEWVTKVAGDVITERRRLIVTAESSATSDARPVSTATPPAAAPVTETEFSDVSSKKHRRRSGWWAPALVTAAIGVVVAVTLVRGNREDDAPALTIASAPAPATAPEPSASTSSSPPPTLSTPAPAASAAPHSNVPRVFQKPKPKCRVERFVDPDGTPRFKKVCD